MGPLGTRRPGLMVRGSITLSSVRSQTGARSSHSAPAGSVSAFYHPVLLPRLFTSCSQPRLNGVSAGTLLVGQARAWGRREQLYLLQSGSEDLSLHLPLPSQHWERGGEREMKAAAWMPLPVLLYPFSNANDV